MSKRIATKELNHGKRDRDARLMEAIKVSISSSGEDKPLLLQCEQGFNQFLAYWPTNLDIGLKVVQILRGCYNQMLWKAMVSVATPWEIKVELAASKLVIMDQCGVNDIGTILLINPFSLSDNSIHYASDDEELMGDIDEWQLKTLDDFNTFLHLIIIK